MHGPELTEPPECPECGVPGGHDDLCLHGLRTEPDDWADYLGEDQ